MDALLDFPFSLRNVLALERRFRRVVLTWAGCIARSQHFRTVSFKGQLLLDRRFLEATRRVPRFNRSKLLFVFHDWQRGLDRQILANAHGWLMQRQSLREHGVVFGLRRVVASFTREESILWRLEISAVLPLSQHGLGVVRGVVRVAHFLGKVLVVALPTILQIVVLGCCTLAIDVNVVTRTRRQRDLLEASTDAVAKATVFKSPELGLVL